MPNRPDRARNPYQGPVRPSRPPVPPPLPLHAHIRRFFDLRYRSVLRGTALVFVSTVVAFRLSHFPNNFATPWLVVPLVFALAGTADTTRCMQKRWNWYHGGVVLCLYTDLMAICMIVFFLLYPLWL